jgi:hypothetical protein
VVNVVVRDMSKNAMDRTSLCKCDAARTGASIGSLCFIDFRD